jgi:S-formylglutathione hydrolase FrmB
MRSAAVLAVLVAAWAPGATASAHPLRFQLLWHALQHRLHGSIDDYTHNHGADNRIWSPALGQKRDLYVYLPPGFDPHKRYPLILWLHGFAQDEYSFLRDVVPHLDEAMAKGELPPAIVAAPDGSLSGNSCFFTPGSFFDNTPVGGDFEDFLLCDVWDFLFANYPLRPEPEAHILAGVSMGGGAAFNKGLKYPERFPVVLGLLPPLNIRWQDCHGRWNAPFDPNCWGWRTDFDRPFAVVGRFFGVVVIRQRQAAFPLLGRRSPDANDFVSQVNPIEILMRSDRHDEAPAWYIGYAGRDEFNIGAQVDSFLYVARQRNIAFPVEYDPKGHHDRATALRLMPGALAWLAQRLAPYPPE